MCFFKTTLSEEHNETDLMDQTTSPIQPTTLQSNCRACFWKCFPEQFLAILDSRVRDLLQVE